MKIYRFALLAAALVAAGGLTAAAAPQASSSPQTQAAPTQLPPCEPLASGQNGAPSPSPGPNGCQSDGVIQPPRTGDRSVLPPPDMGTASTPVIPPPGSPGGNPNVKPK